MINIKTNAQDRASSGKVPKVKLGIVVFVFGAALTIWLARGCISENYRPVALGLVTTLIASIFVWPLSVLARSGWSVQAPEGLESIKGGHDRPGPLMLGVLEAIVFFLAFVSEAWVVAGGWLVFKAASKWASWQHIMKVPEAFGENEAEYIQFRWAWSSRLLTSFLFGTLANIAAAFAGATVARVLADIPLQPTAFGGS